MNTVARCTLQESVGQPNRNSLFNTFFNWFYDRHESMIFIEPSNNGTNNIVLHKAVISRHPPPVADVDLLPCRHVLSGDNLQHPPGLRLS